MAKFKDRNAVRLQAAGAGAAGSRDRRHSRPRRRPALAWVRAARPPASGSSMSAPADIGRVGDDQVEAAGDRHRSSCRPGKRTGRPDQARSAFALRQSRGLRATDQGRCRKRDGKFGQQRQQQAAGAGAKIEDRCRGGGRPAKAASAASIKVSESGRGISVAARPRTPGSRIRGVRRSGPAVRARARRASKASISRWCRSREPGSRIRSFCVRPSGMGQQQAGFQARIVGDRRASRAAPSRDRPAAIGCVHAGRTAPLHSSAASRAA